MTYEQWIAALCIWREARGSSVTAMNAIWHVIQNRAADARGRWPKTIAQVIVQPWQFSSFNASDPNSLLFPAPNHPQDWAAFGNCQSVVGNVLGDDPTLGANGYESLPAGIKKPEWCDPAKITLTVGPFRFYRL